MKELAKQYDPSQVEDRIYQFWLDGGYFHTKADPDKKPYTIVMPPPNVTGQLHMGHALDSTLQDILTRYKRMEGYSALWLPGTDHAGIATQIKVEEELRVKEGKTRYDLGREKFLERVWAWKEKYGVHYIKGMVGKVTPENGKLKVQASDLLDNRQLHIDADLVVLAAAIEPDKSARPLATMLTASMDTNDFFTEAHPKLRPVESPTAGVFLSGMCQGPKDIPETVAQASAAAAKVIGLLCKDSLTCNPCVAQPDEMMCNGCSNCEKVCPYGAITYIDKEFRGPNRTTLIRRVAQVNPAVCQGCGACTVACMSGAMDLKVFSNRQIIAEVDAICR